MVKTLMSNMTYPLQIIKCHGSNPRSARTTITFADVEIRAAQHIVMVETANATHKFIPHSGKWYSFWKRGEQKTVIQTPPLALGICEITTPEGFSLVFRNMILSDVKNYEYLLPPPKLEV